MRRHAGYHAVQLLVRENGHLTAEQHARVHTADRREPQKAAVQHLGNKKADLVEMCVQQDGFRALFTAGQAADHVAVLIRKFSGGDFDKIHEPADAEQTAGEQIEHTRTDLACIEAMNSGTADEDAQQQERQPVQGLVRAGRDCRHHIVRNRLVGKDLLDGIGHSINVLTLQHRSAGNSLDALAHNAVLTYINAVDRGAAALCNRRDLDVRAVLDVKPDGNIQVRLLCENDALARNAALDRKRHLERRCMGIQLVIDLLDRHCIGNIEFTRKGCGHRVLQISSQVSHNLFLLKFYLRLIPCFSHKVA